jgi:ferredoxin
VQAGDDIIAGIDMQTGHTVDVHTCKKCGLCAEVCPAGIITANEGVSFVLERESLCIRCGQCMSVCPSRSITVEGLTYEKDFFPLPVRQESWWDSFYGLIRTRRSIRRFKDRPVPRELLEKIVEAISFAPPGFTPLTLELSVVNDRELIRSAVPLMAQMYESLIKATGNAVSRSMVKRAVGRETYDVLAEHVLPLMRIRMPGLKAGTEDTIARGAPAMILFHAATRNEDIFIALAYGLLAAHSMGLGATAIGLIPPAVERSAELRKMFKIPEKNKVLASMVLGYPKYSYSWGIRRSPAGVTWVE